MVCLVLWLLFPLLKKTKRIKTEFLSGYPIYPSAFYALLGIFTLLYLFLDNLLFDAGELYELTLATAGCNLGLYTLLGSYSAESEGSF